jgi:hypothetical protein
MANPTKAEKDRMERLSRSGCVVCRLQHGSFVEGEIQHLTSGGRRLGHRYTICLCPYHHRAVPAGSVTPAEMRRIYGPSFAESRKDFEAAFGSEEFLLDECDKWLGVPRIKRDVVDTEPKAAD